MRASDQPIAHEIAYLAGPLPRRRAELEQRGSSYLTLREVYGIELASVEDVVETALADPVEASLLGVDTGLPMLLVHRRPRNGSGRPVEWTRPVFRGDHFRFVARSRLGDEQAAGEQAADEQISAEQEVAEQHDGARLDITGRRARARSGTAAR